MQKRVSDQGPFDDADPEGTVVYIGKMAKELSELASGAGYDFLAYLLRMAHDEALKTSESP